jgi:hypothetical protein
MRNANPFDFPLQGHGGLFVDAAAYFFAKVFQVTRRR